MVPKGKSEELLSPLSLSLLDFLVNPLSPPTPAEFKAVQRVNQILSLLGIRTLGGFARLPASTIGPRFGPLGVELHRQARGLGRLPLLPFSPSVSYRETYPFEHPVTALESLLFATRNLLGKLEKRLQKSAHGILEITLFLETESCEEMELTVPLIRPLRHADPILRIVREKLLRITFSAPLISLAIEMALPVRVRGSQFHLFHRHEEQSEQLSELLGRLVAGLGPTVISAAALRERHRPETAWEATPFEPLADNRPEIPPLFAQLRRPPVLESPPKALQVQKTKPGLTLRAKQARYDVTTLKGPERLQGEWWNNNEHARDYFIAQTRSGQHLWLYKDLHKNTLFLHGYFD